MKLLALFGLEPGRGWEVGTALPGRDTMRRWQARINIGEHKSGPGIPGPLSCAVEGCQPTCD